MPARSPSVDELLDGGLAYRLPLLVRFRGLTEREGFLIQGPSGWGEFAPFSDYDVAADARWLAAAVEAAWGEWPVPRRDVIPVNAIIPAVEPDVARDLVAASGCTTVKVKVAESGQSLTDDVARVSAVREELGADGRIRIDANGSWSVEGALRAVGELEQFGLEYVEQPCTTLAELCAVRLHMDVPIAVDEGIRRAPDRPSATAISEAADILILKVAPLGGISAALDIATRYGLPVVVSSALETSIGLSAGLALAAALPDLDYACGLGTGRLLADDVSNERLIPEGGELPVQRAVAEPHSLARVTASAEVQQRWRARATVAYQTLAADRMTQREGGASR